MMDFKIRLNQDEIKELTREIIDKYKLSIHRYDEDNKKILKNIDANINEHLYCMKITTNNHQDNEFFDYIEDNYLVNESVFIEHFIHDVRFDSKIHIYNDNVIIEKENILVKFNWLYNYKNKKYDKFKNDLDLLVYYRFAELRDKYEKEKEDKYIEIPLLQRCIYGDKYNTKLIINFINDYKEFNKLKKKWVDNYN